MSMKNPLTPAGIEPATFRFVAQHLNHFATTVPNQLGGVQDNAYVWGTEGLRGSNVEPTG